MYFNLVVDDYSAGFAPEACVVHAWKYVKHRCAEMSDLSNQSKEHNICHKHVTKQHTQIHNYMT